MLMSDLVAGLRFHSDCVCSLRPVQLGQMSGAEANGAWCIVHKTAASCCLSGTRRLWSGCWQ